MKSSSILILLVFLLSCSTYEQPKLRVIELEGSPYERGLKHGQVLKEEIETVIRNWMATTEALTGKRFKDLQVEFLKNARYKDSIFKWNPALFSEVEGIAEGSGSDLETIFLFQISEEFDSYLSSTNQYGCTAIGIDKSDAAPCYVAQNMDPPEFLHGFPILLHIKQNNTDLESYVFTSPGLIALNGINNKAIGIVANGLPNLYINLEGLPVTFVIRTVLEKTNFEEAIGFLQEVQHAKAQNYILGDSIRAESWECFDGTAVNFTPSENATITYHTNIYLGLKHRSNSTYCSRLTTMRDELEKRNYSIQLSDIKEILRSTKWNAGRPISHAFTYGSTIMELSKNPVLYIAPDQPDKATYLRFDFDNGMQHGRDGIPPRLTPNPVLR